MFVIQTHVLIMIGTVSSIHLYAFQEAHAVVFVQKLADLKIQYFPNKHYVDMKSGSGVH